MELVVEMDSSLNMAHSCERLAERATNLGRFDEAMKLYDDAIMHMENARKELEEEDFQLDLIDLQLSTLRANRSHIARFQVSTKPSTDLKTNASISHYQDDPVTLSPTPSLESDSKIRVMKLPKSEIQTKEELEICVTELRCMVDKLSSKLETTQKELSEERARRLAAEAELLLTRLCDVRSRSTGSIDTESTKLVCATHESADLVLRKDDQSSETETSVRDSTESWFDAPSSFCDQPVT
ncbi:hypothetical protein FBUS_06763 [Fasciolopsis buskii]|uniref:Uncharacterized protein n=1 Tax=Fasciolopsis buskii TaxID=27845 RepID=A0A8E0RW11_9TREM|nr:hypothetical protein FBUS_06763 [Fasciolopsis buski]